MANESREVEPGCLMWLAIIGLGMALAGIGSGVNRIADALESPPAVSPTPPGGSAP